MQMVRLKASALKILAELQAAGGEWVSGRAFLAAYRPTYSQRISELRRAGYPIQSEREPGHPTNRYRLVVRREVTA